jgi:hypothetical protein
MPVHSRDANTGAGQDFTGLAAVVQLRLRVAVLFGLQTLLMKSRLLTGENTVRIRGDPPFSPAKSLLQQCYDRFKEEEARLKNS